MFFDQWLYESIEKIEKHVERIHHHMASISSQLGAVQASLTSIQTGIAALDAAIQAFLSNQTSTLDPADATALANIVSLSATLATAANQIPTAPVTTPPASGS